MESKDLMTRHPSTVHLLGLFDDEHLPAHLQAVSRPCRKLAYKMAEDMADSPELTFGLRQLLLAKDAFVRCAVVKAKTGQ